MFEQPGGYLKSVLTALGVSTSSQLLVFSANSLQREHISQAQPRAIYFNDAVAIGWAKGAASFEAAAEDPEQGVIFYSLPQTPSAQPQFVRGTECLECHQTPDTGGVPGLFMTSMLPLSDDKNEYAQGWPMDHRTPYEDRFGGWYVTGTAVPTVHSGNVPVQHVPRSYVRAPVAPKLTTLAGTIDISSYLTPYSDIVAHLVLNHQVRMTNLLTRLGWEARIAAFESRSGGAGSTQVARGRPSTSSLHELVEEVVDYLLFVDEAPLPAPIRGSSSFPQDFSAKGPRDSKGRSLRDLDLTKRLTRYPCSYMVYAEAFDALPAAVKGEVWERMWEILSGRDTATIYKQLSAADRRAVIEILRDTKKDLPRYFQ